MLYGFESCRRPDRQLIGLGDPRLAVELAQERCIVPADQTGGLRLPTLPRSSSSELVMTGRSAGVMRHPCG